MKIIAFNPSTATEAIDSSTPVDLIPDSALVLNGRPVFVPDIADGWKATIGVAMRIGRLGRDIAPKFALRHVDAFGLALRLTCDSAEFSRALLTAVDSTILIGPMAAADDLSAVMTASIDGEVFETEPYAEICSAVPLTSRFMTLKNGDLILTHPLGEPLPIAPGMKLNITFAGDTMPIRFV
ncbi:MAG: fumarylacetoacetate hydrolase family protein [Lachnoclostridium sp.]|nr:fumarylacetoacetate hydrolase family protein [Lachnoclostridium sp.]